MRTGAQVFAQQELLVNEGQAVAAVGPGVARQRRLGLRGFLLGCGEIARGHHRLSFQAGIRESISSIEHDDL
ncbi:hypothetical protein HC762_01685 [bacterium]|nr:hypothetical protein [bacterium]